MRLISHLVGVGTANISEFGRIPPRTPANSPARGVRISWTSPPRSITSNYGGSDGWTGDGRRHQGHTFWLSVPSYWLPVIALGSGPSEAVNADPDFWLMIAYVPARNDIVMLSMGVGEVGI